MREKYDKKYFKEIIEKDFLKERLIALNANRVHDNYVDLILNQFHKNGRILLESGFQAILLEPLFNLKEYFIGSQKKNFDLLVHNPLTKESLFIEVKGSVNSIGEILKNFEESVDVVKKEFDEKISPLIKLKYKEHASIEFVLVLPRNQSIGFIERINREKKRDLVIWTISEITKHNLKHDISNVEEMVSNGNTHKNKRLREILYRGIPLGTIRTISCLLSSDPCQKLEYYVPLIYKCNLKKFKFQDIKIRIFDEEINFKRYENSEEAKKFVFVILIRYLNEMGLLKIEKERGDIFSTDYSLKINKNWTEVKVQREIRRLFMENYIKKKEKKIERFSTERWKKYYGQKNLP